MTPNDPTMSHDSLSQITSTAKPEKHSELGIVCQEASAPPSMAAAR